MIQERLSKILYYCDMHPNDCQFIQDLVNDKDKEIERLNNIINGLEKWLEDNYKQTNDIWYIKILNKLKDLRRINND